MHGSPSPARVSPATEMVAGSPVGGFVDLEDEPYYRIAAYDRMAPFLMSVPSDTDLWMFVASGGGLCAGRVDAERSLFPYETVDRLHDAHHRSGPVTVILVESGDGEVIRWEPFREEAVEEPDIERYLYKNATGNRVVFEELHRGLALSFSYRWTASDEFGWVRTSSLANQGDATASIRFMDGLRNILPAGVPLSLQQQASNLVDAYKKSEVDDQTGLGIFSLTAKVTDRTEPLESLRANTVWCCGLKNPRYHLSLAALTAFRAGRVVSGERVLNGARGNYLVSSSLELGPGESSRWHIVGDTARDHVRITGLLQQMRNPEQLTSNVESSLRTTTEGLRRIVGSADGIQISGHSESWSHHFANVLFNTMRGGVFLHNYDIPTEDLVAFLRVRNLEVADRNGATLADLPEMTTVDELTGVARRSGDPDFERLCYEYLPLYFSRRHGDPSRPWNHFAIRARNDAGERELNFEGNWRDIFQNWEALATSFPGFLPGMVAKFVNATTVDGFNPYRVTREGVEWEVPSPDDPWSNIGYWGDHQIIYLLKLLETLNQYDPGALGSLLPREVFSYVEIPYRISPYEDILADPRSTIEFDEPLAAIIDERVRTKGSDGRLISGDDGSVYHVNLLEKLLVPILSKLSNFIPGAGVWMNTQRPEWNDANNALGGGAASVVTLCYMRRHLAFLSSLIDQTADRALPISDEVLTWFSRIESVFADERGVLSSEHVGGHDRKRMMDSLGKAFSDYRDSVYTNGFTGKTELDVDRIVALFQAALEFIDHSISANRRPDGLLHTYNQLEISTGNESVEVTHLPEMLEGQVAVLSSGFLDPADAVGLLERLFASALYVADQKSFILYPARELPGFMGRNLVPESEAMEIDLLVDLLAADERSVIARDADGQLRFHGDLGSAEDLSRTLARLEQQQRWADAVRRDRAAVLDLFETVFDHQSYTGRSGVMYGYEGLGCIYWHMVAKLLLAVQENYLRAGAEGCPTTTVNALARMYYQIRSGIGYEKTAAEFGAFPIDPYSHTPSSGGARQPGMTGQVKEEILTRIGELGVRVAHGSVSFRPTLLRGDEYLERPTEFQYFDVGATPRTLELPTGSLAFTLCQVPVLYQSGEADPWIEIDFEDGSSSRRPDAALDAPLSTELFSRNGRIRRIRVGVPEGEPGFQ